MNPANANTSTRAKGIIGLIAITLAVVACIVVLVYCYRFVRFLGLTPSVAAYMAPTVLVGIFEVGRYFWRLKAKTSNFFGKVIQIKQLAGRSKLYKARFYLAIILNSLAMILESPFRLVVTFALGVKMGAQRKTNKAVQDSLTTSDPLAAVSLFKAIVLAVLIGIMLGNPENRSVYQLAWIVLLSMASRHLGYIVLPELKAITFKRDPMRPLLRYVRLAFTDVLVMLLVICIIHGVAQGLLVNGNYFYEGARYFWSWQFFLTEVWPPNDFVHVTLALGVALFYTSVLQSAINVKQFQRSDEDWVFMAQRAMILGNYEESASYAQNIKVVSVDSLRLKSSALFVKGEFEGAENAIRVVFQLFEPESSTPQDPLVVSVSTGAGTAQYLVPSEVYTDYFTWLETRPEFGDLELLIIYRSFAAKPQLCDVIISVIDGVDPQKYPLLTGFSQLIQNDLEAAHNSFSSVEPTSATLKLVRIFADILILNNSVEQMEQMLAEALDCEAQISQSMGRLASFHRCFDLLVPIEGILIGYEIQGVEELSARIDVILEGVLARYRAIFEGMNEVRAMQRDTMTKLARKHWSQTK